MPFFIGMSGMLYLFGAIALGGGFLYYAFAMQYHGPAFRSADEDVSFIRLPTLMALFGFLMVDHYLLPAIA